MSRTFRAVSSVSFWHGLCVSEWYERQRLGSREERVSRQRRHVEMEAELAAAALGVGRLP